MKFVELARFDSRLEAEAIGHALDQYDIPFLVQSAAVGMFGMGMMGKSPVPVSLCVPDNRLAEVRQLLSCVAEPIGEDTEPTGEHHAEGEQPSGAGSRR